MYMYVYIYVYICVYTHNCMTKDLCVCIYIYIHFKKNSYNSIIDNPIFMNWQKTYTLQKEDPQIVNKCREKMFNIIGHQVNAKEIHNEILLHTH